MSHVQSGKIHSVTIPTSNAQAEKCTIAWFKLAEFVARREKERALAIYRLLIHSIPDEAVQFQLEGDILFAFNDGNAVQCYARAAECYERNGKHVQAIAVYEQCQALSQTLHVATILSRLYAITKNDTKMIETAKVIIDIELKQGNYYAALNVVEILAVKDLRKASLYEYYCVHYLENNPYNAAALEKALTRALTIYSEYNADKEFSFFMTTLMALNSSAYAYALSCLATYSSVE